MPSKGHRHQSDNLPFETTGTDGTDGGTITDTGSLQLADSGVTVTNGQITLNGLTTASSTYCQSAGQGLSWNGSTFGCTTAYSYGWNLQAASGTSTAIGSGATVNFNVGGTGGLAASRSGNTVTYTLNLSGGRGLTFDSSTGTFALPNCTTVGYVLKWNGSAYTCQLDKDTIADVASMNRCNISWNTLGNWDSNDHQNYSYQVGSFVYYEIWANSSGLALGQDHVIGALSGDGCIPHSHVSHAKCTAHGGFGVDIEVHVGTLVICYDGVIIAGTNFTRLTDIRINGFVMNKTVPN